VAVNSIYASIIPSYKYNLVLKSFSYGTLVMGHPVYQISVDWRFNCKADTTDEDKLGTKQTKDKKHA
jgi:hypothetical protein